MTTKTRYFVVASLLILTVGLGTGLVAYYVGFQPGAGQPLDELRYVPSDASLVAFADVRAVMVSEVRRKLLDVLPSRGQGQREFEQQTGINIETDIDRVVVSAIPPRGNGQKPQISGIVLVRGRFNNVTIESLMRDHGAQVEEYKGRRLLVADAARVGGAGVSLAFLEPGLVGVGSTDAVREAVDLGAGTGDSVTRNTQVMDFVKSFDGNAWAVGRFDVLTSRANLPPNVASQIPPITWFSVNGRVDGGLSGVLRAEARDEQSASSLRDVVRGVVALARLQAGAHPELQPMIDSLQLAGTGNTVTLSFALSPDMFEVLTTTLQGFGRGRGSR